LDRGRQKERGGRRIPFFVATDLKWERKKDRVKELGKTGGRKTIKGLDVVEGDTRKTPLQSPVWFGETWGGGKHQKGRSVTWHNVQAKGPVRGERRKTKAAAREKKSESPIQGERKSRSAQVLTTGLENQETHTQHSVRPARASHCGEPEGANSRGKKTG